MTTTKNVEKIISRAMGICMMLGALGFFVVPALWLAELSWLAVVIVPVYWFVAVVLGALGAVFLLLSDTF